jgi:DNA-binding Xre family transcriptional regulator
MHIGQRIKEVLLNQHKPVTWLAREINCERTNVYNIFSRKDISTGLLEKICHILNHDFFKELSEETFKGGKQK